jgi:pyrrolidone-carboxylate peptidase
MKTQASNTKTAKSSEHHFNANRGEKEFFKSITPVKNLFFGPDTIQPKLKIGQPNDTYEQQADRVAYAVMRMPDPGVQRQPLEEEEEEIQMKEREHGIQLKCAECEHEEKLQTKSNTNAASSRYASPGISSQLQSEKGSGSRLPRAVQSEMGNKIGADFSGVKIHSDSNAVQMNKELEAKAFTYGADIYFNEGHYNPASNIGKYLLAHELAHVVQQRTANTYSIQRQPLTATQLNELCYLQGISPSPDASEPEFHPTYESWISSFHGLRTFQSDDTVRGGIEGQHFTVLGSQAARRFGEEAQSEGQENDDEQTAPVPNYRGRLHQGEQFIDHPTNRWVQNCLPANLRATAFGLPADCADIAVILRHVWLSAHNRSERYNGWNVGDRAGDANESRALHLTREVGSYNAEQMVNPYSNSRGNPIQAFAQLQLLLHPGDILVWDHRRITSSEGRVRTRRTGGHVQTISHIAREDNGSIRLIQVLQGNQPIFRDSATEIANTLVPDVEHREQEQQLNEQEQTAIQDERTQQQNRYGRLTRMINRDRTNAINTMRNAPGRRIEVSSARGADMVDPTDSEQSIWGRWDDRGEGEYTLLVAAGPPRSASRPGPANRRLGRRILDWNRRLSGAGSRTYTGNLEAMLQETRSLLERDQTLPKNQVSESDLQTMAITAGNRFRRINIRRRSLESIDTTERDEYLQKVAGQLRIIEYLGNNGNSEFVQPRFNHFAQHFVAAAAPGSTTEELRSYVTGPQGPGQFIAIFENEIEIFREALGQAADFSSAEQLAESNGRILWQHAVQRASNADANTDDRPIYWTRLRMIQEIRYFNSSFDITTEQRNELVEMFERNSRGQETARLSRYPHEKKVVISGFDPFNLHSNLQEYNQSGAAVLALDGSTVRNGDISAQVEGVIFPVRFRDFNEGRIENFFGRYLIGDPSADMIMTISRGGSRNFEVERYAGRRRSSDYQDNEALYGGGTVQSPEIPQNMGLGDEFLETSLPQESMSALPGVVYDESRTPDSEQAAAVEGSGGGYLSNEIFYRVRRLSLHTMGTDHTINVGHLHTPYRGMSRDQMIRKIRDIIRASLPHI